MEVNGTWAQSEIDYLTANYSTKTAEEIAFALCRTPGMVYKKAQLLRLVKARRWLTTEIKKVVELLADPERRPSPREIATHLENRSGQAVEGAILRYDLLPDHLKVFNKTGPFL